MDEQEKYYYVPIGVTDDGDPDWRVANRRDLTYCLLRLLSKGINNDELSWLLSLAIKMNVDDGNPMGGNVCTSPET